MYIRLEVQTIRLRISQQEANNLLNNQMLTSSSRLSQNFVLHYSVKLTNTDSYSSFSDDNSEILLFVNREQLAKELQHRPSKQGIEISHDDKSTELKCFLEIDIKKG